MSSSQRANSITSRVRPIARPAHQAIDIDVRHALEAEGERQLRPGDGTDSSGPERST